MKKLLIICLSFVFIPNVSSAASSMDLDEYIEGMNVKTSDVKSLQRGARNFFNYCSGCHTLQYMRYNQIAEDLGITEDQLMQNLIFTESSPQNLVMNKDISIFVKKIYRINNISLTLIIVVKSINKNNIKLFSIFFKKIVTFYS